ncbi:MAG: glutamine cyclotransferase [Ignavibacteriae bacterium HGW-Ignavibacteriae-1]|nr:MAG: glutamine cyclotransferase [Ignavibacteriae bacterium HGW-Ignavibacteriae-1]
MKYTLFILIFLMISCSKSKEVYVVEDENIKMDTNANQSESIFVTKNASIPYDFELVRVIPKEPMAYTQGLLFHNGQLYESTGQYGRSSVRIVDHNTGKVLKSKKISPQHFGEGIAIMNDKLYMLTWTSRTCFVFDPVTFKEIESFTYPSEGWGLTDYGDKLIKSDGSYFLKVIDPETFREENAITVVLNGRPLTNLNELEYVNGLLYANIYMSDKIAVIEPETGEVLSIIDFGKLRSYEENNKDAEAFNGIAYNPATDTFYVTGKDWLNYFEIKFLNN